MPEIRRLFIKWANRSVHGLSKWYAKFSTGKFRPGIVFTTALTSYIYRGWPWYLQNLQRSIPSRWREQEQATGGYSKPNCSKICSYAGDKKTLDVDTENQLNVVFNKSGASSCTNKFGQPCNFSPTGSLQWRLLQPSRLCKTQPQQSWCTS